MFISPIGEPFHNVYQITTRYTLSILQFHVSFIMQSEILKR